jgi:hypothetical protein
VFQLAYIEEHYAFVQIKFFAPERAFLYQPRDLMPGDAEEFGGTLQCDFTFGNLWFFSWSIK